MSGDFKNIIWLASYPKSGNTWFRAFLTNLLADSDIPAEINKMAGGPIASSRCVFENITNLSSTDLSFNEIDNLRPAIYLEYAKSFKSKRFLKVHDAFTYIDKNTPLFPADASHGVVYIIRNPFDVAISFSHHSGSTIDNVVNKMNDSNYAFASKYNIFHDQIRQNLLSWSMHVRSWTEQDIFPVCVLRFEDMKDNPEFEFAKAIEFAGFDYSENQIKKAVEFSKFEILTKQEDEIGFKERSSKAAKFFRAGKKSNWRDSFSAEMINSIVENHKETMIKYGYMSINSEILV